MRFYNLIILLIVLILVESCSGAKDKLVQLISRSLRDGLSEEECAEIRACVLDNEFLQREFGEEKNLADLVDQIAQKMAKRRSSSIEYPLTESCFNQIPVEKVSYSVYLENSASMDGYYQGDTEFKKTLYNLLNRFNGYQEPASLHFINQDIYPIQKNTKDFISYLSSSSLAGYGNRSNSKLDEILELVINKYKSDKKPAILVSDFIFSLNRSANLEADLDKMQSIITNTFQGLGEEDGILVMKFSSAFNGTYFDMNNGRHKLNGQLRPYYLWLLGPKTLIYTFMKRYEVNSLENYEDFLILDHTTEGEEPYHAILPHTLKSGRFSVCRDKGEAVCLEQIDFNDRVEPKVLNFALAIDLANIPLNDGSKLSASPFIIESDKGDPIKVKSVHPISVIESTDERYKGKATHALVLHTESLHQGEQVVTLKMKKGLPDWVAKTHGDDDTKIEENGLDKTFAFSYLINGVNQAFNPYAAFYFEIPITIRNN